MRKICVYRPKCGARCRRSQKAATPASRVPKPKATKVLLEVRNGPARPEVILILFLAFARGMLATAVRCLVAEEGLHLHNMFVVLQPGAARISTDVQALSGPEVDLSMAGWNLQGERRAALSGLWAWDVIEVSGIC